MARELTSDTPVKIPLRALGAVLCVIGVSGGSLALAEYRINDVSGRLAQVEAARSADRELLVRIDERTAEMKRLLETKK